MILCKKCEEVFESQGGELKVLDMCYECKNKVLSAILNENELKN